MRFGIAVVVGNPKANSRTLAAATALTTALGASIWPAVPSRDAPETEPTIIDLATIAGGLLAPWLLSPAATEAATATRSAALVVLATPTYKASYTGLLKLFLDTFPAGSLSHTVVVPLITSGGPAHRHLADIQLRPVLAELGAVVPAPSLLVEEADLPQLTELIETYVATHARLLTAAATALQSELAPP